MEIDIRDSKYSGEVESVVFASNTTDYCSKIRLYGGDFVVLVDVENNSEPGIMIEDIPNLIIALKKVVEITNV